MDSPGLPVNIPHRVQGRGSRQRPHPCPSLSQKKGCLHSVKPAAEGETSNLAHTWVLTVILSRDQGSQPTLPQTPYVNPLQTTNIFLEGACTLFCHPSFPSCHPEDGPLGGLTVIANGIAFTSPTGPPPPPAVLRGPVHRTQGTMSGSHFLPGRGPMNSFPTAAWRAGFHTSCRC